MVSLGVHHSYGFVGLGAMGYWMAKNLRAKSSPTIKLYVYDIASTRADQLAAESEPANGHIVKCMSVAEVVQNSDVIFTIVPEGKHVLQVFSQTNNGALSVTDISGKLFIDCSTIDVSTSQTVARAVAERGADFFDAPVSGGTVGALEGTITFMLGTSPDHPRHNEILPILQTMGNKVFACGAPTLGLAAKLCNNYISGNIAIATAEGMNLGMKLGLNPKTLSDVVAVSTGGSWVNQSCNPVPGVVPKAPASNNYEPGFKVELMLKDYNLAVGAAATCGAKLYLAPVGLKAFTDASQDPRCTGRDARVVFRLLGGDEEWQQGA